MTTLNVPSADFWTVTPFRIDLPEGWTAEATVDHLVYMRSADELSNCSVRWSRTSNKVGLHKVAQISHANLRRIDPDVRVGVAQFGKLNGVAAFTRVSQLQMDSRTVVQTYFAIQGPRFDTEHPVELFEITGHIPPADADRLAELESITTSFRFALKLRPVASDEPGAIEKGA